MKSFGHLSSSRALGYAFAASILAACVLAAVCLLPAGLAWAATPDPATLEAVQTEGQGHYVITEDKTLWATFYDEKTQSRGNPVRLLSNVERVCSGAAITSDGSLWLLNEAQAPIRKLDGSKVRVVDVACTQQPHDDNYLCLMEDGSAWSTQSGRLENISKVGYSSGLHGLYAIGKDGTVWAWMEPDTPQAVASGVAQVNEVSATKMSAIKTDGRLVALDGIKGGYEENRFTVDTQVASVSGSSYVKKDGTLWIWDYLATTTEPIKKKLLDGVAVNGSDLVLKSDGTVWAPKYKNNDPQYPDWAQNTVIETIEMVQVADSAQAIAGCLILKKDGSVWAPFSNGQQRNYLGNDPSAYTYAKIFDDVASIQYWSYVNEPSIVIKTDGSVYDVNTHKRVMPFASKQPDPQPTPSPAPTPAPDTSSKVTGVERLRGTNAFGTMQQVVSRGWKSAGTVVVAAFDGYWDALAASSLAGKMGAPVLMTSTKSLSPACASEIDRLGAKFAYIVGGNGSVSADVEKALKAKGLSVKRLKGKTAVGTALAIAQEVGSARASTCVVATSAGFYDALAASPYAYAAKAPIYLTRANGQLDADTLAAIKAAGYKRAVIAGGKGAVWAGAEAALKSAGVAQVDRCAGKNAYLTAQLFAEWAIGQGMSVDSIGVATAKGYWDALTGAALCGRNNAVLVLADDAQTTGLDVMTAKGRKATGAFVFGGKDAVGEQAYAAVQAKIAGAQAKTTQKSLPGALSL